MQEDSWGRKNKYMKRSTKLTYSLDKFGHNSSFQIALEAWRRGLTVTFVKDVQHYKISSENNTHFFFGSALIDDDLCLKAIQICQNKADTKKYLSGDNVTVPMGMQFGPSNSNEEIINFAESFGFPLVLKPTYGYQGKGVFTNIKDPASLREYLVYVRQKLNFKDVILEENIEGDDLRIFVIGDKAVASVKRIPANITGNGKDSIKKLINNKNLERNNNLMLRKAHIIVDNEIINKIQSIGYNLNSVPKEGEKVFLRNKCNTSAGGDPLDVTEDVSDNVKYMAIQAVKAIPGLQHGGVDVLYNADNTGKPCVVIEINSYAMICGHLYPLKGKRREAIADLIDYYFPESIPNKLKNKNLFFNFKDIRTLLFDWKEFGSLLNNSTTTEVTLTTPPVNTVVSHEIIVSGKVQGIGFRHWVQKQAIELNLFGFAENIKSDRVKIVIAGEEKNVKTLIELCKTGPVKTRVENLFIAETCKPVYLGFHIKLKSWEFLITELKSVLRTIKERVEFYFEQNNIY